jgi:diguanylate cyclase (GGDEF)-like protein
VLVSLLDRRLIVVARERFGRFGVRLALGVVLALALAEGLTYWTVSASLLQSQIDEAAALHRADAASLIHAVAPYKGRADWSREANEQLRALNRRDGALEAILVDRHFQIVAGADRAAIGRVDRTPRLSDAFRTGRAWVGHEADLRRNHSDFEFVELVTIHGTRYAFEITTDGDLFDAQLASVRKEMLIAGGFAFLGAAVLFWLAGGRRVLRMHRFALERATRDGLTDLANHRAFQEALRQAGEAASRYSEGVALLLLDLDSFKSENDRHGHRHGDDRLKAAALALTSGRPGDLAFRVGGDEFALLLTHTDAAGASRAANRLRKRLADEHILASIGVGVLRPGQSPYDLREEVDAALYEAKRAGGDRIVLFDDISDSVSVMTATRRDAFSQLIVKDGIDIAFQPIWDLPNNRLLGVEALARPRGEYGFAGPAEAFDTAYQLGRVHELDRLCVDRILARAPELPDGVLLFVNLSPQTLELDADGSHWFTDAVAAARLDPARVVIEVTERMGSRTNRVTESIRLLRDRGFHIAIDDMGSGNSGLEMLRELQPEYVKLDRSVVVGALTDPHARGILMGVTAFAHETGAFVIAEGIEDEEVLNFVNSLPSRAGSPQIDGGQGYGLGRPDSQLPTTPSVPRPAARSVAAPAATIAS